MKFLSVLIFCGSVRSLPVNDKSDVPQLGFEDEIENENSNYFLEEKSASGQCPNIFELQDDEDFEQPSRLSLPTLMTLSNEDTSQELDIDKILSEVIYQPVDVMVPADFRGKAQISQYAPVPFPNGINTNNKYYMQDPIEMSELPYQLPVRSLPPISMQIHESLLGLSNYYESEDDSEMDNGLYVTPNVRSVRSRDEDLLALLKHEAMIPNIIPTMPIPFVRTSDVSPRYPEGQKGPLVMVIFPGKVPDCALPFLFDCSPETSYGTLVKAPNGDYSKIPPAVPTSEYRKEPDSVEKSREVIQLHRK